MDQPSTYHNARRDSIMAGKALSLEGQASVHPDPSVNPKPRTGGGDFPELVTSHQIPSSEMADSNSQTPNTKADGRHRSRCDVVSLDWTDYPQPRQGKW